MDANTFKSEEYIIQKEPYYHAVRDEIEVFESGTVGGKEAQGKMDNKNEFVRKMLKNKYDDIMGDDT